MMITIILPGFMIMKNYLLKEQKWQSSFSLEHYKDALKLNDVYEKDTLLTKETRFVLRLT
jgi:hypothetical protein